LAVQKIFGPRQESKGMSKDPKTTVIIPCYNGEEYLPRLLHLLSREPCNIVAVDDGSSDGSWEVLKVFDVEGIRNPSNLGFARTNNRGAARAETPYLLFLNQDMEPMPGFIRAMERHLRRKKVGVVGAKLIFARNAVDHLIYRGKVVHLKRIKGMLDHAGIGLNERLLPYEIGRNRPASLSEFNQARKYPAVNGGCLMVKREIFEE